MNAVVLEKPGQLAVSLWPEPDGLQPGEALVRVRRIGICGTDLHAYRGQQPFFSYPRILGHELGVEVLELCGETLGLNLGDACVVEPYLNCGACIACRRGKPNCCVQLQVLGVHTDGGMREQIVVPINKLHASPQLTYDQLALVETLGIGAHAVDRAALEPNEAVLVIGAGPIGLSVIQFAQIVGAQVIVLDLNRDRLDFCRRHLGVEHALDGSQNPVASLQGVLAGELPTVVFDATGNSKSMTQAFGYVAHGGKLVMVGLCEARITFHDPDFHRRELSVLATRNSTGDDFRRIIRLVEAGRIDTRPWVTHRATLAQVKDEFPGWLDPVNRVVKAMVEI